MQQCLRCNRLISKSLLSMKNPISYNNSIVWLNWSKTAGIDLTFDFQLKNRNASIKISLSESSIRTEIKDPICIWKQVLIHQRLVIGNVSTTRMKGTKTEQTRNWEAIEAYEKQTSTTQEKQSKVKQMREKKRPTIHRCSKSTFDSFFVECGTVFYCL